MGEILESFSVHGERVRNRVDGGGECDLFWKILPKGILAISGNRI